MINEATLSLLVAEEDARRMCQDLETAGVCQREAIAVSKRLPATGSAEKTELLQTGIGRYTLELQLEGTYLGTLHYLKALEALPWKFFWESADFEIIDYPVAQITLELYTLGLVEG